MGKVGPWIVLLGLMAVAFYAGMWYAKKKGG